MVPVVQGAVVQKEDLRLPWQRHLKLLAAVPLCASFAACNILEGSMSTYWRVVCHIG